MLLRDLEPRRRRQIKLLILLRRLRAVKAMEARR